MGLLSRAGSGDQWKKQSSRGELTQCHPARLRVSSRPVEAGRSVSGFGTLTGERGNLPVHGSRCAATGACVLLVGPRGGGRRPNGDRDGAVQEGLPVVAQLWNGSLRAGIALPKGRRDGGSGDEHGWISKVQGRRRSST